MSLLPFLHRVVEGEDLNALDARLAMGTILSGEASPAQIAAFLAALRMKGETPEELVGFARAMRRVAITVDPRLAAGTPLLDTCGTGGDNASTFNISTVAAFVVAGAGVAVAKHGNRALSSECGSADLVESLGVNVHLEPDQIGRSIREVGIGFLFAPALHTATKFAQPVRLELKMRTVFNLLGPLTNPAGATAQLVGAPSEKTAELMAEALASLGLQHGFVVHGSDGLDEITTTGSTIAFEVWPGSVVRRDLKPENFGVPAAQRRDLRGGNTEANKEIALEVLSGKKGPKRDVVLVNASAALVAAGRAASFTAGVTLATEAIDTGGARRKLDQLISFTHS